jgi:hypothetical protein
MVVVGVMPAGRVCRQPTAAGRSTGPPAACRFPRARILLIREYRNPRRLLIRLQPPAYCPESKLSVGGFGMTQPTRGPKISLDADGQLDEFFANNVIVHFEAMNDCDWWIGITDQRGRSWSIRCGSVTGRAKGYSRVEAV